MDNFLNSAQMISVGVSFGLACGYLRWRAPADAARFMTWWQAKMELRPRVRAEIERIEGAFRLERQVPIQAPKMFWGERLRDRLSLAWGFTGGLTLAMVIYDIRAVARQQVT